MKFKINESKLESVVSSYLDDMNMEEIKWKESGDVFIYGDSDEYPLINFFPDKGKIVCLIHIELINDVGTFFGLSNDDTAKLIVSWLENKYKDLKINTVEIRLHLNTI